MSDSWRHHRRPPYEESVSVPAQKRRKLSHETEKIAMAQGALRSPVQRGSSGESGGSDQTASRWFNHANEHVKQSTRSPVHSDEEPPFYMSAQDTYNGSKFQASESGKQFGVQSRMDSENEDLRGVIDDLTVENKRLKHILRSQHGRRSSPVDDSNGQDKLFEVRMHGLSPAKRRELECLLKNFATSVHTRAPSLSRSTSNSGLSSSSNPVKQIPTDSGYASNSGLASSGVGQPGPNLSRKSKDKHVKDYLHDIPDTLMPRQHPLVMTERAKMALVVRRLEQLFTGKTATPGDHSQPMQQQEVSRIAARADAKNTKARTAEGQREAHILSSDIKVSFETNDTVPRNRSHASLKTEVSDMSTSELNVTQPGSPEQRPTRPLDLDIHRAQVAAENIDYIRHLGLSSPRLEHAGEPDETSWLYLNLLINMAQLHTINVTPDFVRKAIKKLSTKFELSKDGYRVRWSGGLAGTVFSKEEEKALEAAENAKTSSPEDACDDNGITGGSKSSKTASASNAVDSNTTSEQNNSGLWPSDNSKLHPSTAITSMAQTSSPIVKPTSTTFDYKPHIYRADKYPQPVESYLQDTESSIDNSSRDSSGLAQAVRKSSLKGKRVSDAGLLTFYSNPYFCSDCSGDKTPHNLLRTKAPIFGDVLGMPSYNHLDETAVRFGDACYFTPQFGPIPHSPAKSGTLNPFEMLALSAAGQDESQPIELPASGLYGVCVDDNFVIDVKVGMTGIGSKPSNTRRSKVPFTGTELLPKFDYKVMENRKIQMLPSRLPSPSYIVFTSSSSSGGIEDDASDDDSDEESTSSENEGIIQPGPTQNWLDNSVDGSDDSDIDEDMDVSSVDMLAAARAADPEQVAEQERQYIITAPGGGAIAGSLAATVGASESLSSENEFDSDGSANGSEMDTNED